jgi:hypothetical protein
VGVYAEVAGGTEVVTKVKGAEGHLHLHAVAGLEGEETTTELALLAHLHLPLDRGCREPAVEVGELDGETPEAGGVLAGEMTADMTPAVR